MDANLDASVKGLSICPMLLEAGNPLGSWTMMLLDVTILDGV